MLVAGKGDVVGEVEGVSKAELTGLADMLKSASSGIFLRPRITHSRGRYEHR
jgi:formylmethanofuran dehydrogenase subunit B